jgi:hypothetical protein
MQDMVSFAYKEHMGFLEIPKLTRWECPTWGLIKRTTTTKQSSWTS